MKSILFATLLAATALAAPQGVVDDVEPHGEAPDGCKPNYDGKFEFSVVRLGKDKRDIEKRECTGDGILAMTLKDGVLEDAEGRIGYVSDSYQFQFDSPPQSGALYTAGFSACGNGSIALGSSTVFYQCRSGDFYNIYDRSWAEQCEPIEVVILPCGKNAKPIERKVVGSSIVATTIVTMLNDGQPQVRTATVAIPMCQIGDGQVQIHTTPCASLRIPEPTTTPKPPPPPKSEPPKTKPAPPPHSDAPPPPPHSDAPPPPPPHSDGPPPPPPHSDAPPPPPHSDAPPPPPHSEAPKTTPKPKPTQPIKTTIETPEPKPTEPEPKPEPEPTEPAPAPSPTAPENNGLRLVPSWALGLAFVALLYL